MRWFEMKRHNATSDPQSGARHLRWRGFGSLRLAQLQIRFVLLLLVLQSQVTFLNLLHRSLLFPFLFVFDEIAQ
jgi:hypothetical protein